MVVPGQLSISELFGGAMVLGGGIVLVVGTRYVWRATAVFRATEVADLTDVDADTLVRVAGSLSASDDELLVAPFSGTDCVVLRQRIEERRLSLSYILPWYVTVYEATGAVSFDVETHVDTIPIVEPARTVALTTTVVETVGPGERSPERIREFERANDEVPPSTVWREPPAIVAPLFRVLSIGTRRYSEQRAAIGDEMTIVGRIPTDASGIDPLVVADRSPFGTVFRMAKTSIVGLCIGLVGVLLGLFLLGGV